MKFIDQYKHPKWQEKRVEVFSEIKRLHGYLSCQRCGDSESKLNVHHKRYVKNRMLWEYEFNELEVLCDDCHADAHIEKEALYSLLVKFDTEAIPEILSLIAGYANKVTGACSIQVDASLLCSNEQHVVTAGEIAGLLVNRCNIYDLTELYKTIISTKNGEDITFKIEGSKKNWRFDNEV